MYILMFPKTYKSACVGE